MTFKDFKYGNYAKIVHNIMIVLFLLTTYSCVNSCPEDKKLFLVKMDNLIVDIKNNKRLKTNNDWDLIDKKFRRAVFECHPKISKQLSEKESIIFWENALGYVYVRYGADLLKKYAETDQLLIKIRDNVFANKIVIKPALNRLCKEWPVLYGSSEEAISDLIKDVFEMRKKDKILTDSLLN